MALQPRNTKAETSISKAINKLEVAQQEMYSNPVRTLRLMHLAINDINRSYMNLANRVGIKIKT